jgi:serine/threonine protein kinase
MPVANTSTLEYLTIDTTTRPPDRVTCQYVEKFASYGISVLGITYVRPLSRAPGRKLYRIVRDGHARVIKISRLMLSSDKRSSAYNSTIRNGLIAPVLLADKPYIVPVLGQWVSPERIAEEMNYFRNGDLLECLLVHGPTNFPWVTRLALVRQIVEIVVDMHGAGVGHGDLTPENMLIVIHQGPDETHQTLT